MRHCIVLIILGLFAVVHLQSAAAAPLSSTDYLTVQGEKIITASGNEVLLRGTNIGGWLVQESWMSPTNAQCQLEAMDVLDLRFGRDKRKELMALYDDHFITETDLDFLKDMGITVLRLPFWYRTLADEQGALLPDAFSRMDRFVTQCKKRGLYVILDLHGAPGSQNGKDHSGDVSGANLFESKVYMDQTVALWETVAAHYKDNPAIAMYDLLNEPLGQEGATTRTQWDFYDRLYKAIRAVDANHIITLESCWEAANLPHPKEYGWQNVVYQYHAYKWGADNDAAMQTAFAKAKILSIQKANYGVPTLIGEFTVFQNIKAWDQVLAAYNEAGFHWTTWSYKVKGPGSTWGIQNMPDLSVDIHTSTEAEIRAIWGNPKAATVNQPVYDVIKKHLP